VEVVNRLKFGSGRAADGPRTYGTLADALVDRGVPADRIEFIHDYPSAAEKQDLFRRCREGDVSVLVGSTSKMGTGVNVQTRLSDVHHLTLDWKPALMEQREGRGLRPGNLCPEVGVWYHIGEGTSDVMQLCVLRNKDAFIRQFIEGRERVIDVCNTDEDTLTYDDMMAHATGDSRAVALSEVAAEVVTLQRQRNAARVAVRQATDLHRYTEQRLATSRSVYNELGGYSVVSPTAPFVEQDGHRPLNRQDATALLARAAYQRWRTANYAYADQAETIAKVGDVPRWVRSHARLTTLGVGPPLAKLSTSLQGGQVINAHNAACGRPVHGTVPDLERRVRNLLKQIPATRAAAGQRIPQLERDLESTAKAVNKAWPHHQLLARKTAKMEAIRKDINENPIERPVPDVPVPTRAIAGAFAAGEDMAALLDRLEVEHRGPEYQTADLTLAGDHAGGVGSDFIDRLANKVIHIEDGDVEVYPGGYEEFLWSRQRRAQDEPEQPARVLESEAVQPAQSARRDARKRRMNPYRVEKIRVRISAIEDELEGLEEACDKLQTELATAGSDDLLRQRVLHELEASQQQMQRHEDEWTELSEQLAAEAG